MVNYSGLKKTAEPDHSHCFDGYELKESQLLPPAMKADSLTSKPVSNRENNAGLG